MKTLMRCVLICRKKLQFRISEMEEEVKGMQTKAMNSEKSKNRLAAEVEDLAQELEAVSLELC